MKKGVIIELKDQYTYVLCPNAQVKRIKREYHHEIGKEIQIPYLNHHQLIPLFITACLVLSFFVFNSIYHQTPVQALSYISLKVNPGLVLKVDENQKIIAVSYTNKDGQELTQKMSFVDKKLNDGVVLFIDYCFENHYFQNNHEIDINVISDQKENIQSLEKQIRKLIEDYIKTHSVKVSISMDKVSSSQQKDAQNLNIPDSKMKLIDLILKYYPNKNKQTLARESVDDLIEYLEDKGFDEDILDRMEDDIEGQENDDDEKDDEDDEEDDEDDD